MSIKTGFRNLFCAVLILGNPFCDRIVRVSEDFLPSHALTKSSTTVVTEREKFDAFWADATQHSEMTLPWLVGGSGTNVTKVLARLGEDCTILGIIGADQIGREIIARLTKIGVTSSLHVAQLETGIVNCYITPDAHRTMQAYVDPRIFGTQEDIPPALFQKKKFVLVEGYTAYFGERMERVIELATQNQAKVSLDLASLDVIEKFKSKLKTCISKVDYLFGNEQEMLAFTGCKTVQEAVESFPLSLTIVATMGPKGCWVKAGGQSVAVRYDAPEVQPVIDTTGAGDFFLAGFMLGVMRNKDIPECVKIAQTAALYVIQEEGADLPEDKWAELNCAVTASS